MRLRPFPVAPLLLGIVAVVTIADLRATSSAQLPAPLLPDSARASRTLLFLFDNGSLQTDDVKKAAAWVSDTVTAAGVGGQQVGAAALQSAGATRVHLSDPVGATMTVLAEFTTDKALFRAAMDKFAAETTLAPPISGRGEDRSVRAMKTLCESMQRLDGKKAIVVLSRDAVVTVSLSEITDLIGQCAAADTSLVAIDVRRMAKRVQ